MGLGGIALCARRYRVSSSRKISMQLSAFIAQMHLPCDPLDICDRVGGDEYMVSSPSCPLSDAGKIAERMRASVDALQIETKADPVSPSVGPLATGCPGSHGCPGGVRPGPAQGKGDRQKCCGNLKTVVIQSQRGRCRFAQ